MVSPTAPVGEGKMGFRELSFVEQHLRRATRGLAVLSVLPFRRSQPPLVVQSWSGLAYEFLQRFSTTRSWPVGSRHVLLVHADGMAV